MDVTAGSSELERAEAPAIPAAADETGLQRWLDPLLRRLPGLAVFDAHTHIGTDCDGTICEPDFLLGRLEPLGARAATFPLHLADGDYLRDNDEVIAVAAESAGRLVPFARINPHARPGEEARRAVAAGARGIKLHPRAEQFTLAHPAMEEIFAVADEHGLPVLIHAGRGIEPLGADALRLAAAHPRATLILAHACITDLAWIFEALDEHPNVLFDTAWWNPADLLALFALVPPGRIVFGSDVPFGDLTLNAILTLRSALAVGLDEERIAMVMGGQLERLLDGEALADLGPAPGEGALVHDLLLHRVGMYLAVTWGNVMGGGTGEEPVSLARMALAVPAAHPYRGVCDAALEALDMPKVGLRGLAGVAVAAALVATPHVAF